MVCSAPRTGINCTMTYADSAGKSTFLLYQMMYVGLGLILGIAALIELKLFSKSQNQLRLQMQQNYEKTVYYRLLLISIVFLFCSIDPLGYSDVIGVNGWLIFSGISTFLLLSVCISLIFAIVRGIALVGQKQNLLVFFNRLYLSSHIILLISWVGLPIVQAIVKDSYMVEALKLTLSSIVFLLWTIGSLSYGKITIKNLEKSSMEVEGQALQSANASDVYLQRMSILKSSNKFLFLSSMVSIVFVIAQILNAYEAVNLQTNVNFDTDLSAPRNFKDLFVSGIFEFLKITMCFAILTGMGYLRRSRRFPSVTESSRKDLPLTEMDGAGSDPKRDEAEDEESHHSHSEILGRHEPAEDLAAA
jgi:hypothetical protein